MATHSSILAWRIPWTEEPGGLHPFQTTQGNRLSCRDQKGKRGSEEAVPGPSVFPSGDPGLSGDLVVPREKTPTGAAARGNP